MAEPELNGIPINEAAELLGVHRRSVMNWIEKGVGGIRLRAWKNGRQWFTSLEAIGDFQRGCTPRDNFEHVPTAREKARLAAAMAESRRRHGI